MTCVNLVMVQIKDIQALVLRNHDRQTHNQPLIAAEFARVAKRSAMTGKQIEKEKAETEKKFSGICKFKSEYFEADEGGFYNLLSQKIGTTKAELR